MNSELIPTEIAVVFLIELLFGLAYNGVVAYWAEHRLMHVSWSVVIGVCGTLLIPALFWFDLSMPFYQSGLLLVACFTASGAPMIVGSMRRTVARKDDKKRRPLGNAAMRIRDDVVMELAAMAHEIAERSKSDSIRVQDLPDYVHRLHGLIGSLKSL